MGDRFTTDKTPPTELSPAALTRGWKLIGFLIAAAFLTPLAQMEKHAHDASQRRIWLLGELLGQERELASPHHVTASSSRVTALQALARDLSH